MERWRQTKDNKLKRGKELLNIGDYITYHDSSGEDGKDLYEGRWQVLGTDDEGRLLIVSEDNVAMHSFNKKHTLNGAMEAYSNALETLDKICAVYAKGTNAVSARSIRIEDVDKLTRYDKYLHCNYGKPHTYINKKGNTFIWHDGTKWNKTSSNKKVTLINTFYWYYIHNTNKCQNPIYDMLFGKKGNKSYWLASSYVWTCSTHPYFGLRCVYCSLVDCLNLVYSEGVYHNSGVRAVVTLETNI